VGWYHGLISLVPGGRDFYYEKVLAMFQPVSSKVNFPQIEENILGLWKNNDTFGRSVRARQGSHRFVFYEGPPTANGSPGIHHVLARVFKDVIPRYKTMKGYYAPRIAGWDTHGLPVELEVERKLGFSSKAEIEEYGVDRFNDHCRKSVFGYLKEWEQLTERIGFWVDLEHAYITMDNKYIESVWWAVKQMWDKGLVYQGYKVTPHCPRCGTSLSSHEVALGYQDIADISIYVRFRLSRRGQPTIARTILEKLGWDFQKGEWKGEIPSLLAWTTTPWTLTGNVALAVAPDEDYVLVQTSSQQGVAERLILAKALLDQALAPGNRQVLEEFQGKDLAGILYERFYEPKPEFVSDSSNWRQENHVVSADFVSMEDGTGIVHIAPAFGEEDYELGQQESLPIVQTVDLGGRLMPNDKPWDSKFVKDADPLILDDLNARGLLYRSEIISHSYPFCWRCDAPLLYYAKQTWYIKTTAVKEVLIAGNNQINWYPEHIKYGRFGDWLENNVDWAFSRERYWGTPLPVWQCESCGKHDCIGSVKELENKPGFSGFNEPLDLHRPFVDEITFDCPHCRGVMRRVPEVIDCWFDSGAMPIAQWHYPFDNDTLLEDGRFPADYICEAVDQTRGWFYSLHAISTLLFNRPCFKNVICLGHILDAKGEKMSKARGNVVEPSVVINKYGADALRWYCLTSSPPGNVRRFSEETVAEITRRFLLTLWNVYSFFVTYANIDHFIPGSEGASLEQSELDRWITSELNQLIVDVETALDGYNPTKAGRRIESFVSDLSNWYVRRSRRRFWKSENDADKLAAYTALYQCLVTLSKLLAPFTPFLAEELYQNLVCSTFPNAPDSVHLADFPVADKDKIDKQLADDTRVVMEVCSMGRSVRSEAGIKVRQPLPKLSIKVKSEAEKNAIRRLESQVLEEVNVKRLEFLKKIPTSAPVKFMVSLDTNISPELAAEGMAREIVHRLQTMRRSAGFDIADYITTYYQGEAYIRQVMEDFADYIKQETLSRQLIEGVPEEGVFTESYKLGGYDILLGVKKSS